MPPGRASISGAGADDIPRTDSAVAALAQDTDRRLGGRPAHGAVAARGLDTGQWPVAAGPTRAMDDLRPGAAGRTRRGAGSTGGRPRWRRPRRVAANRSGLRPGWSGARPPRRDSTCCPTRPQARAARARPPGPPALSRRRATAGARTRAVRRGAGGLGRSRPRRRRGQREQHVPPACDAAHRRHAGARRRSWAAPTDRPTSVRPTSVPVATHASALPGSRRGRHLTA